MKEILKLERLLLSDIRMCKKYNTEYAEGVRDGMKHAINYINILLHKQKETTLEDLVGTIEELELDMEFDLFVRGEEND